MAESGKKGVAKGFLSPGGLLAGGLLGSMTWLKDAVTPSPTNVSGLKRDQQALRGDGLRSVEKLLESAIEKQGSAAPPELLRARDLTARKLDRVDRRLGHQNAPIAAKRVAEIQLGERDRGKYK